MSELKRSEPPYYQIYQHYRQKIISGDLVPGDRLPSAADLNNEWGISKATAARVSSSLQADGLAKSVSGVGLIVTETRPAESGPDRLVSVRRTGRVYPPGQRAAISAAGLVPADADVAARLGLEAGESVIERVRITYQDEVPVSASTSYHPGRYADLAPKLLHVDRIIEGPGYLEAKLGRPATRATQEIDGRQATPEEQDLFGLDAGACVLAGWNTLSTEDGEVIEYGKSVRPFGRRYRFDFSIPS